MMDGFNFINIWMSSDSSRSVRDCPNAYGEIKRLGAEEHAWALS
jgi:hypothetical protein